MVSLPSAAWASRCASSISVGFGSQPNMQTLGRAALPLFFFAFVSCAHAQWERMNAVTAVHWSKKDVVFTQQTGRMKIQVCSDTVLHIVYTTMPSFPGREDYVITKKSWAGAAFTVQSTDDETTITTGALRVVVARKDGAITYNNLEGLKLVQEGTRKLMPVKVNGEETYHAESFFNIYGSREGLYGLGQHQAGVWNYRGESVDISQDNTNIAVPFLVSSNGYGIYWNNDSRSRFNNRFANYMYVSSEVADAVDYYFFYGPDLDKVLGDYRDLTGAAPMFGKWAYGYWQCKNRYKSQAELLGVAQKYRELKIPIDNIVQDWFWWNRKGEHVFNQNYPDPKGMIDQLHKDNVHLMISVWPFFEPGSKEYEYMDQHGFFIERFKFAKPPYHQQGMAAYDPTNPEARKYYWDLMDKALFNIGVDAWWLDTTEPETEGQEESILLGHKLFIGSGDRYANIFPLMTTRAVYEGQRAASDDKRVFILSRSAFAGAQRYGVTAWSGDVLSDWLSYKRQIPAGLNYSVSGLPYWTTDIGGFISGGNLADPNFRELFVRWFQFGAFSPVFRVHGTRFNPDENELWSYGPDAEKILVKYDNLRYRLLPYIYSLAWKVTSESYTPMRPLVMDFREDVNAQNVGDQYMYGPAILVNPVTEPGAQERRLYLPQAKWFDFWTGAPNNVAADGGKFIDAPAPIDRMPLYVRAGSIIPLGPEEEYSNQKPADPIELRVYPGADGSFTLYEDENDNYNYEQGVYSTIVIHWDDAKQQLK